MGQDQQAAFSRFRQMTKGQFRGRPLLAILAIFLFWTALRGGMSTFGAVEDMPFAYRLQGQTFIASVPHDNPVRKEEKIGTERINKVKNRFRSVAHFASGPEAQDLPHDRQGAGDVASPWFAARTERAERPWSSGAVKRLEAYLFTFWRGNGSGGGLAPVAQYGGSQTGAIVRYRISDSKFQPKLALRAVYAPPGRLRPASREIAVGVSARPLAALPVDLTVERRFVDVAPDKFVIYAAGGRDNIKLPEKFRLSAFGQVGTVPGKGPEYFYDFVTRAERPIAGHGGVRLRGGAGGWAGGQKGVGRLDIGPTLEAELPVGRNNIVRLYADYRIRIAGDAVPGNGPALTVATGF